MKPHTRRVQLLVSHGGPLHFTATAEWLGWNPASWPEQLAVTLPRTGTVVRMNLRSAGLYATEDGRFTLTVATEKETPA